MVILFGYVFPIAIIAIGGYLSFFTDLIKDQSLQDKRPYSFSKAQMLWWTLIIVSCMSALYAGGKITGELNVDPSWLYLLGISAGTVAAGKVIDDNDNMKGVTRHQDVNPSSGFFTDMLSDGNGFSIHRFQAFVFNLFYGLMFISEFKNHFDLIKLSPTAIGLMSISSAAYLGVKMNENKGNSPTAGQAVPGQVQAASQQANTDNAQPVKNE
ncbi:MAG: hypothetical protein LWX56_08850 [Ignavibacteria bacterium]|nr:hypothetical protein [Ignavibacteria bacterium]